MERNPSTARFENTHALSLLQPFHATGVVAVKLATGIASTWQKGDPVWREGEVIGTDANCLALSHSAVLTAMMSMQNKRLVRFLGAGVMSEPAHGLRVLFTIQVSPILTQCCLCTQLMDEQEFMSGGSIDTRIWNQPLSSVTWKERVQWCKDTAEVLLNQPEQVVEWMLAGDDVCAPFRLCSVSFHCYLLNELLTSCGFSRDLKSQNVVCGSSPLKTHNSLCAVVLCCCCTVVRCRKWPCKGDCTVYCACR